MLTRFYLVVIVGFAFTSCTVKETRSTQSDEISGAYVREYSFKVVNPEGGNEIGFASIRDTILIKQTDLGYEVTNHKWRLNDYDEQGWKDLEHSDDRPIQKYLAAFSASDSTLVGRSVPALRFNHDFTTVHVGDKRANPHRKIF